MMKTGDVINQIPNGRLACTAQGHNSSRAPTQRAPVFVIGAHRSGTTLLRFMLSSLPQLYLPPESEFIPALFGRHPERPLSRRRSRRILAKIFRLRFTRDWRGDRPAIDDLIPAGETVTPDRFLDALYSAYAARHGADRWGDKTPTYSSHVDLLHRIFPSAMFIHLIRDGRDVALSVLRTWGQRIHVDPVFAARTWRRRVTDARRSGARLGAELYLEVRYEDLVVDPEVQLRTICRFIGEEFHPAMLEHQRLARRSLPGGRFHGAILSSLTPSRIGRWRREMSPGDLRTFEAVAGPTLEAFGYPPECGRELSVGERGLIALLTAKYAAYRSSRRLAEWLGLRMPN